MNAVLAPHPPSDTITSLSWSPSALMFSATSWNGTVSVWEASQGSGIYRSVTVNAKSQTSNANVPVLSSSWIDGSHIVFGGCDNKVKIWDLQSNQVTDLGQHNSPVKHVSAVDAKGIIASGGWDGSVRYWDPRQRQSIGTLMLSGKVHCMDVMGNIMVVGTSDRNVHVVELEPQKFQQVSYTFDPILEMQSSCIACYPGEGGTTGGFVLGCVGGRVAVRQFGMVQQQQGKKPQDPNFTFRCHRKRDAVYSVNAVAVTPMSTFATAGGDGNISFWDKDNRQRLKQFPDFRNSISCCAFSRDGKASFFVFAESYDWQSGPPRSTMEHKIHVTAVKPEDVQPKKSTGFR